MRLNSKYLSVIGGMALIATGCSSEDLDAPGNGGQAGQTVNVTLTVSRPAVDTRTIIEESTDKYSLTSKWKDGDKLMVANLEGKAIGYLELQEGGAGSTEGVFKGTFDGVVDGGDYRLWYLGAINDSGTASEKGAYTALQNDGSLKLQLGDLNDKSKEVEISGMFADLNRADLLSKAVTLVVNGTEAAASENVMLESQLAMARFHISGLPDGIMEDQTAKITVKSLDETTNKNILPYGVKAISASNELSASSTLAENRLTGESYGYVIPKEIFQDCKATTVNLANGVNKTTYSVDVYLPLVPGEYKLAFDVVSNGRSFCYSFGNSTTLKKGKYYSFAGDLKDAPEVSPGISVGIEEDDLVGKMFEIDGKKFRFTRGNLKYNTETGAWSLMANQYDFICKGGWTTSNGSWCTTVNPTYQKVEKEIDLFGYGCTGLYDIESDQTANAPTYWRQNSSQTDYNASYYYPTQSTTWNGGFTGSYLQNGIKFTNFDWGKAYYLYKRGEAYPTALKPYTSYDGAAHPDYKPGDPVSMRYFTLSSDDWTKLQSKYFMCGVTITGIANPVNTNAKNNIYGCLIFPITGEGANSTEVNDDKFAKVKALLAGHYTYVNNKMYSNLSFSGTNFDYSWLKMTVTHFKELEELGVVFLPEAGHRAMDSYAKTDSYYWTSTNGQDRTATIFKFDGDSSPRVFKLDGQSGRVLGCAVRLVKEVPADYEDPKVVD